MLLQHLKDLTPAGGQTGDMTRPYARIRSVPWELMLDASGVPRTGLIPLADPTQTATKTGQPIEIPNSTRTVGIAPNLGADDIQYVLGWADDKSKPDRVAHAHTAFADLSRRWAARHPDDPVAAAIARFYDTGLAETVPKPPKWSSKDLVVVSVDGVRATDTESMWQVWEAVVEERKAGGDAGRHGLCLVCGQPGILLDRMPQSIPKPLVPRAENEIALISANKAIHGYDYREGLATAPICVGCGKQTVANLTAILSDDDHTFSFPRQRTRLAWWITKAASSPTIELLRAKPDAISNYLTGVTMDGQRPRRAALADKTFCSVTVSGNYSRLVVHDWIEMPLQDAEERVHRWFHDMKVVPGYTDKPTAFGIWSLVLAAGQWQPNRSQPSKGTYIALFDKAADRPDDLAQLLLRGALHGAHLPPLILGHIVRRIRTDRHIDTTRIALVRVALTRSPHRVGEGPAAMLDDTQSHPAYLHGRLFAVLESLQYRAYPKQQQPNTTFFHRYFAGAVANPRIAITQGTQLSAAWIKKLDGLAARETNNPEARTEAEGVRRAALRFRARIRDLHDRIGQPARSLNSSEDQSWFILGYYHQQAHDIRQARAGHAPEIPITDENVDDPHTHSERNDPQ